MVKCPHKDDIFPPGIVYHIPYYTVMGSRKSSLFHLHAFSWLSKLVLCRVHSDELLDGCKRLTGGTTLARQPGATASVIASDTDQERVKLQGHPLIINGWC